MKYFLDLLGALLILGGTCLVLVAALGLVRLNDLLSRMHAATKAQVSGLLLLCIGLALTMRSSGLHWMLLLVVLLTVLTAPVSAHMVARAGYRTGRIPRQDLSVDELTHDLIKILEAQPPSALGKLAPETEEDK
ncbi:monovalent cation/H(+) antiporter subunit G [Buchananella hordeovulneris]|uniref:Uncharacterized protein n=1 Tax=Buchananella hordeovulneris TaxID=52770 RepID=A0A1Q5PUV1_9ACTO|nr:monovalent cation/H(+) antiporter subunit G [Buchananella hordeovulneris]MDO5080260.1 monovalent cation/H(+) antiporter subunit G [Buchananella hordeovulneris]OKL51361.1 hypothetical protein BSZ40_07245 [Buchananella hordeovulneris]RRD44380.1 monovalent cation/H(+) antiporter subunit G [Buchananella hordeovulneris]RRD51644.1 monovalent cation/H(+) antiporter subunit G [Buchananella hordeovulneris]